MAWHGNLNNPVPNIVQEPISRSDKFISNLDPTTFVDNNRAKEIRRDVDTQRNFTITLQDIDTAIMEQLEQLQLQVVDSGKQIKVPIFFGSPERWVSAARDGYLRDKQGRILLPAIIFKRTTSEPDSTLQFFNRYLNASAIKLYSQKNQYTRFSALLGKNAPINEIYNVIIPSHMLLTYHFIIWTEYVEQMNKLIETIQFNTKDYWGSSKGFRFRTKIDSYGHTIEIQADEDRMVKTEFDLTTHGYILPDTITYLERHKMTTQKMLSPKKMIFGMEVVATDFDLNKFDKTREKWRNPHYPNLQIDVPITPPPISVNTDIIDNSVGIRVDNSPLFLRIVPVPTTQASISQDGAMSYDYQYFYFYVGGWKRVAISEFIPACSDGVPAIGTDGSIIYNTQFFYIYSKGFWRKVALVDANISTFGQEGDIMYDTRYIYIYIEGSWKKVAIASFS